MNDILCKDVCLLLPLYIENMLSDEEMTQVCEHLASCSSCRNEYDLLKGIMDETENLTRLEVSESFTEKLHTRLMQEAAQLKEETASEAPIAVKRKSFRLIPVAAACAAVVAVSLVALNRLPDTNGLITKKMPPADTASPQQTAEPVKGGDEKDNTEYSVRAAASSEPKKQESTDNAAELADRAVPTEKPQKTGGFLSSLFSKKNEGDAKESKEDINKEEITNVQIDFEQPENKKSQALKQTTLPTADFAESEDVKQDVPALSPNDEDITSDASVSAPESAFDVSEDVLPRVYASGGGGGGSASAGSARKTVAGPADSGSITNVTMTFYFEPYALREAQNCMQGVEISNGRYVVSTPLLQIYADRLCDVDGYISSRSDIKDYTSDYNRLLNDKVNGVKSAEEKIQKIEEDVSKNYIILAEK